MHPDFERHEQSGCLYRWHAAGATGKSPLIVFLHGVGERGADNERQLSYPFFASEMGIFSQRTLAQNPCHVFAPQAPADAFWTRAEDWRAPVTETAKAPTAALVTALAALSQRARASDVDADRVYLVGLSMGAFGVYDLLARQADFFAAAVAICGAADLNQVAKFKNVPLLVAHGAKDKGVPVERSRDVVKALKSAGGTPVYWEYPAAGHDVWNEVLGDEKLTTWLLAQRRVSAPPT